MSVFILVPFIQLAWPYPPFYIYIYYYYSIAEYNWVVAVSNKTHAKKLEERIIIKKDKEERGSSNSLLL